MYRYTYIPIGKTCLKWTVVDFYKSFDTPDFFSEIYSYLRGTEKRKIHEKEEKENSVVFSGDEIRFVGTPRK